MNDIADLANDEISAKASLDHNTRRYAWNEYNRRYPCYTQKELFKANERVYNLLREYNLLHLIPTESPKADETKTSF